MTTTALVIWLVAENHSLQDTIDKLYSCLYYATKSCGKEPNKDTVPEDRDTIDTK